jgi:hypothetical protein
MQYEIYAGILIEKFLLQLWSALIVDYTMTNIQNICLTKSVSIVPYY